MDTKLLAPTAVGLVDGNADPETLVGQLEYCLTEPFSVALTVVDFRLELFRDRFWDMSHNRNESYRLATGVVAEMDTDEYLKVSPVAGSKRFLLLEAQSMADFLGQTYEMCPRGSEMDYLFAGDTLIPEQVARLG